MQVGIIDAHPPLPIGLLDENNVCEPLWIVNFANKVSFDKLGDLVLHCSGSLRGELSPLLPYRMAVRRDVELVGDHLRGDP